MSTPSIVRIPKGHEAALRMHSKISGHMPYDFEIKSDTTFSDAFNSALSHFKIHTGNLRGGDVFLFVIDPNEPNPDKNGNVTKAYAYAPLSIADGKKRIEFDK